MAFSSTVTRVIRMGPKKMAWGTFTNTSTDSGGSVKTGLNAVDFFVPVCSSHLGTESVKITPSAGTVTIVTSNGADGYWMAIGS